MTAITLSTALLGGRTGRGVRVAIIDSGVHVSHPHVGGIAGGIAFDDAGRPSEDIVDRLGHGTAVAAAIHEKAPGAALFVAKVFDRSLATTGAALVAAIRWSAAQGAQLINLSLGTTNPQHEAALAAAVRDAAACGSIAVAAAPEPGRDWLPGRLTEAIGVTLDWTCAREECLISDEHGRVCIRASGFPRPIPGVAEERNLKGLSFAVANATGLVALALEGTSGGVYDVLTDALRA